MVGFHGHELSILVENDGTGRKYFKIPLKILLLCGSKFQSSFTQTFQIIKRGKGTETLMERE